MPYIDIPKIEKSNDAYWYHSMDLANSESVIGDWDLRGKFREYTGGLDFRGTNVLDVGTASGFLAFEAEKAGAASVVSLDMPPDGDWDVVPYARDAMDGDVEQKLIRHLRDVDRCKRTSIHNLRQGFYYAHTINRSSVRLYESSVYSIGEDIGLFDVAIVGSILLHLTDPFKALHKILSVTKSKVVISDLYYGHLEMMMSHRPLVEFVPNPQAKYPNELAWWRLSVPAITMMLDVLGFECQSSSVNSYPLKGIEHTVFTIVGNRVRVVGDRKNRG